MNLPQQGQLTIEGKGQVPQVANGYNMPAKFDVLCKTPGGVDLQLVTGRRQGVMFEGSNGNVFVNRGGIYGKPVDELKENPLPDDAWRVPPSDDHMRNFIDCVKSREEPVSPVRIQQRTITTCHLTNLSLRLGRPLKWDPKAEQIVGDTEANGWLKREQRKPYIIKA